MISLLATTVMLTLIGIRLVTYAYFAATEERRTGFWVDAALGGTALLLAIAGASVLMNGGSI